MSDNVYYGDSSLHNKDKSVSLTAVNERLRGLLDDLEAQTELINEHKTKEIFFCFDGGEFGDRLRHVKQRHHAGAAARHTINREQTIRGLLDLHALYMEEK